MKPVYDLDKIKFATDGPTFAKAVAIYESGGVKDFADDGFGFSAKVRGSAGNFYAVYVSAEKYDAGNCDCYLGQNDTLCKHMVAAAIFSLKRGGELSGEEKERVSDPTSSGRRGDLSTAELKEVKADITASTRLIKPYNGPSRIWFAYQDSLSEGCNRLSNIVSGLPVSGQTAKLLVGLLLRLDRKLSVGGVDDSDGTVGGFIEESVHVLEDFARLDPSSVKAFETLEGRQTCFDWEEPLVALLQKRA